MDKQQVEEYLKRDHLADVEQAAANLQGVLLPTPLRYSNFFSKEYNCDVYIKPENLQLTGSFKIRGAYNKIIHLSPEERRAQTRCHSLLCRQSRPGLCAICPAKGR